MANKTHQTKLTLFHKKLCPYCAITRKAIRKAGLDIPLRDVAQSKKHRNLLIAGGGKLQVPCLRIDSHGKPTEWLYESTDIITYLRERLKSAG